MDPAGPTGPGQEGEEEQGSPGGSRASAAPGLRLEGSRRGKMAAEGAGAAEAEAEAERCRGMVDTALARAPVVKFLLEQLEAAGCGVGPAFFAVERCSNAVGGGFRPPDGVVVCSNHLKTQTEIDNVLAHELIHAFDHCRAKDLDWGSCVHHACSEVRAANLSGDCHMKQEWLRGNLGVLKQHQACVKRRAELSVAMNPLCAGAAARRAVDRAFPTCFKDTAPFDDIP